MRYLFMSDVRNLQAKGAVREGGQFGRGSLSSVRTNSSNSYIIQAFYWVDAVCLSVYYTVSQYLFVQQNETRCGGLV